MARGACVFPFFFFFNDTATTEIYTLSLHDALPISWRRGVHLRAEPLVLAGTRGRGGGSPRCAALRPRRTAVLPAGVRAAHREGPAWTGAAGRQQAGRAARLHHRRQAGYSRSAHRLGRRARADRSRRGHRRPGRASRLFVGDCRGHLAPAGDGERRGGELDPVRRRAGGPGPDRPAAVRTRLTRRAADPARLAVPAPPGWPRSVAIRSAPARPGPGQPGPGGPALSTVCPGRPGGPG